MQRLKTLPIATATSLFTSTAIVVGPSFDTASIEKITGLNLPTFSRSDSLRMMSNQALDRDEPATELFQQLHAERSMLQWHLLLISE